MYRLVIVDDENDIREALITLVDWKNWGYTVVGGFRDAESAIEYVSEEPVDVILTDIRMREKSGIDIAKFVKANCPETKVIILSGYKEFQYAKEAIDNDVYSYLLKPTDPRELKRVFAELKEYLDSQTAINAMNVIYSEQLVHSTFYGYCDVLQIEKFISSIRDGLDIGQCKCSVIALEIKDYDMIIKACKYEKDLFYTAVTHFINMKFKEDDRIVCSETENEKINIITFFEGEFDNDEFNNLVRRNVNELCEEFYEVLGVEVVPKHIFNYKTIYDMAQNFFKEYNSIDELSDISLKTIVEMKKEIVSGLFSNTCDISIGVLKNYISMLSKYGIDICKTFVNNVFIEIYEEFAEFDIDNVKLDFGTLLSAQNENELYEKSSEYLIKLGDFFRKKDIKPQIQLVENAKKYIYNNYSKDISLNDVSNAVFVSTTYLSRVFKKITGVKFVDFLAEVRLNKAKELLSNSDYKIYDICDMLGYKNLNYFVTLFKKKNGMTPLEYRKFNSKNE